ncbi:MAG TPA: transporter [Thiothrix sp.]|nr:transporter [Thiothrix sp.]
MKHSLLIRFSLPCLVFIFHGNVQANTTLYQQLDAATTKNHAKQQKTKTTKNKRKNKRKNKKITQRLPPKPSPFPVAGKLKILLQYSMSETTGNQLYVDGFSLLPIFVAGNIESQDIVRTGHTLSLFVSRSLAANSQISLSIPYRQESEELTNDEGQTTTQTRKSVRGLGDIRLTYSKQLFKHNHRLPNLVGDATWKTTTGKDSYENTEKLGLGSGFNSLRTGIRAMKQDDPAFLYAGVGYTWNFKDKKSTIGSIKPGNAYDLSFGASYSLTDSFSMNFGLEQGWAMKTTINGVNVVNSDKHTAALAIGGNLKVSAKRFISIRTKIGLNEATPGFQLQIGMPLKI